MIKRSMIFGLSLVTLVNSMLFSANNQADELDIESLLKLSLEDLVKVKFITASKFEEPLKDVHASVTIIDKKEIDQFGGHNLFEILERIVSVNSNFGVLTSITTRGSKPWTSLYQHLGLINGRPVGNLTGIHGFYTSIPLSSIERIEYIRGPGSVLYGTNAYQGVFNIITNKAENDGWQAQQKLTIGSFETQSFDASYRYRKNDLEIGLNVLLSDVKGWDAKTFDPVASQTYSRKAFQKEQTFHFELTYNGFSFSHYNSKQERFANYWDAPEANYIPWSKVHPVELTNLSYELKLNQNWGLESHFTWNKKVMEWDSEGVADEFIIIKSPLESRLFEFNLFGQLSDRRTLIAGLTHETRIIYDAATIPDANEKYASLYFKYQEQLTDSFSYSLGGQYVTSLELWGGTSNQSDFVPRLGLVYDINNKWSIKLLHGQAYRHPTAGERSIETPEIQRGTPDLEPETVTSSEAQLFYQTKGKLFTLTYYQNEEKNLILLVPSDDPLYALENKNVGEISSKGIELELKYQINNNWYLEFSSAWQKNEDGQGIENINLAPNNSWKLGIGYSTGAWNFGLYNLHYSKYHDTILFDPNRELVNPPANGFDWLTLKASKVLRDFDNGAYLELSFEMKNILDEEVYQANDTPVFYPINTLPGREGRSLFMNINYNL